MGSQRQQDGNRWTSARRRAWKIAAGLLACAIIVVAILVSIEWPFTQEKLRTRLQSAASGTIRFGAFHTTYFPPGCLIEGVELIPSSGSRPLLTAKHLAISTSYRQMIFHQRLQTIRLNDVHLDMGQILGGSPASQSRGSNASTSRGAGGANSGNSKSSGDSKNGTTDVIQVLITGATIDVPRSGDAPLVFKVYQLALDRVQQDKPITFHLQMDNPLPPGRVRADGQFNPWNHPDIADTSISGAYHFTDANLAALPGIAGTLASQGSFAGPARALRVQGTTDTPNYQLTYAGHPMRLRTEFQAVVDCRNGNVALENVQAHFGNTTARFTGSIMKKEKTGARIASLHIEDEQGRIEDWLRLMTQDLPPPMVAPISFSADAEIHGGKKPFVQRVRLVGDFELQGGSFTNPQTEKKLSDLSLHGQGQKPPPDNEAASPHERADIKGHVESLGGVAHFSNLFFSTPGASANMRGMFNLNNETVDLRGELHLDQKLSKSMSGPKAFLSRVTEKLVARQQGNGEILPVQLTGTYEHPSYGLAK